MFDRLTATALFVQRLRYAKRGTDLRHSPINILMTEPGNCSELTDLYTSLLCCAPYDMNRAYSQCDIVRLGRHMVAGINVRTMDLSECEGRRYQNLSEGSLPEPSKSQRYIPSKNIQVPIK